MATITNLDLADLRRKYARKMANTGYGKPTINAGLQAIEDWAVANVASLFSDIDAATSPFVFTAAEKKKLFAFWCSLRFRKDG